jgi:hypothetical protein
VCLGIIAAGIVILAAVTIVGAHGPGPAPGIIHSCVKNNGDITIVGATDTCKNNETALDWNAQGAPGPAGVSGYEWLFVEIPTGVVPPLGTVGIRSCVRPANRSSAAAAGYSSNQTRRTMTPTTFFTL